MTNLDGQQYSSSSCHPSPCSKSSTSTFELLWPAGVISHLFSAFNIESYVFIIPDEMTYKSTPIIGCE